MTENLDIRNEELELTGKTGEDFFPSKKEQTVKTTESARGFGNGVEDDDEKPVREGRSQTPLEISRTGFYNSEKRKNDAKTAVLNILKYLIPIFTSVMVGLLAVFGGIWAYKLNNIAEPIGGIKVEIQYIKENINELKTQVKDFQNKLDRVGNKITPQ
jgi:cell division protein FtsB